MAAMNVKLPTKAVVESLKKKLVELQNQQKTFEKHEKDHESAMKKYQEAVKKFRPKGTPTDVSIRTVWNDNKNVEVRLEYTIPASDAPIKPEFPEDMKSVSDTTLEELRNAIRILSMTEEATVNASTFKSIHKFL
jgi:ABC-type transporter MlaC component